MNTALINSTDYNSKHPSNYEFNNFLDLSMDKFIFYDVSQYKYMYKYVYLYTYNLCIYIGIEL